MNNDKKVVFFDTVYAGFRDESEGRFNRIGPSELAKFMDKTVRVKIEEIGNSKLKIVFTDHISPDNLWETTGKFDAGGAVNLGKFIGKEVKVTITEVD